MAGQEFITIADKLVPLAETVARAMKDRGYSVRFEPKDISLPATPVMMAKRAPETIYIFVTESSSIPEIKTWIRFCEASASDSRLAICLEHADAISATELASCKAGGLGIGVIIDAAFHWLAEPRDIAFHVSLPERTTLKPHVRTLLGDAYDRFDQRDWRAGFESACLVLEEEGRKYLLRNQPIGRVSYKRGNKQISPSRKEINRMTLGSLAMVFCNLVRQNQIEAQLCSALDRLNPSRIHRIHKARRGRSEAVLRRQVGAKMWLIVNALNVLPK